MSTTGEGAPRTDHAAKAAEPVEAYRALLRTSMRLRRETRKLLNLYGLTGAQYGLLIRVPPEGITLTQLAETAWADPGNTSGVIDRLAREGWVKRVRSEEDRRVVNVMLSDRGKALLMELTPRYTEVVSRLMGVLSQDEIQRLKELLMRLESGLFERVESVAEANER